MTDIIECPQCHRKLRMDESVLGQTVQCPACQTTFVAQAQAPPPPPMPTPYRAVERPEPGRGDYPPRRGEDDYRRRREDDEDYPRPRRYRDDYGVARPHRGATIQTLGILGLVLFWMFPVGLILCITAITMASSDLDLMRRGLMDRSGESATNTGKTCGIIGLCLTAGFFVCCCMLQLGRR
jgi:hypothetical protein